MEIGGLSDLAWIAFFGIVLIRDLPMFVRWLFARRFWSAVIKRENLDSERVWCRVKVNVVSPDGSWLDWFSWPTYALVYLDRDQITLQADSLVNGAHQLTFARESCVMGWHGDQLALQSGSEWIHLRAAGCWSRSRATQKIESLWRNLQPEQWQPYGRSFSSLRFDLIANSRTVTGLFVLILLLAYPLIEVFVTNPYWLLDVGPYTWLWWVLVLAAVPIALWLIRGGVPTAAAGIFAGLIALALPFSGYAAVKRIDQWVSEPTQYRYMLVEYNGRQLIPLNADKPAIHLLNAKARPIWDHIALGTEHQITLYGGVLGTVQIDVGSMLPNPTTIRR